MHKSMFLHRADVFPSAVICLLFIILRRQIGLIFLYIFLFREHT
jgi:hypothetical protein